MKAAARSGRHTLPGIVQDALARIGSLLDTLFESTDDAIFLMDGMHFIDCNPATLRMFGCSRKDEIVGQTPFAFSPPRQPDGPASDEKARRLVATALDGVPQLFEWRHWRLDRSEFDVEVRLNRFIAGGSPFVVAVVRDITARKEAEAALTRQIKASELVNRVLSQCANCTPEKFDLHMVASLKELSRFLGVDHAYFFITSPDRTTYSCTHESCGPGVSPLRPHFQQAAVGTDGWIEHALVTGKILKVELPVARPEGMMALHCASDPGCRSLLIVPTTDPGGACTGAIGVDSHSRRVRLAESDVILCNIIGNALTSLTERKRAMEKLTEEKRFTERLIESLPGTFYLYDSSLRLRRWNRNHEAGMGYTAAEIEGKLIGDWQATEEDRRRVLAAARRVLEQGGETEVLETRIREKDGTAVPYLVSGARIDTADGPMLVGVGINISARLKAERALAESERDYRELFNATSEALFVRDESGHVIDANERALAMFGCTLEEARRLSLKDTSFGEPPYTETEGLRNIQRAIHEGPHVFEWRSRRLDGSIFWSEIAMRAFRKHERMLVIASVRDITERKLAALERERLMAEVQDASSAKDRFLAVLSHELRNPLAAIQAGVDLLQRSPVAEEPRLERAMEVIRRNVKLQARLVSDLLDLSRLVRAKLTIQRAPLPLDAIVLSALQSCRGEAERSGIRLETRLTPGLWIDADADRIQQVVINLAENGIKFTSRGGRVSVAVEAKAGMGRIVVEDTGVGIEAKQLPDLFEMFRQGQIAARRAPGLGIGLALVRSITELHGGRVWAESEGPGRGSRFTVELPLCEAPRTTGAAPAEPVERRPLKMLLIEDSSDTRSLLVETLSGLAYEVVPAENAEVALDILTREKVDVIVADIGLPGMDGYEFLRRARRLPNASGVTAFALTGYGQASDARLAYAAGYADHFVKPVDAGEIDRRIRSLVEEKKVAAR